MKLTYTEKDGILYPNIKLKPQPKEPLTKYGLMRLRFLKEHKRTMYRTLLWEERLKQHCLDVQKEAEERVELLMQQMAEGFGVNEELKEKDQMKWVGVMNNIQHSAEEIVLSQLIYI